ncbi:MAG: endonuclease domain-containing protein [Bacteroidota bacterium]
MDPFQINNRGYLKDRRKSLRNEPTEAEHLLWQELKGSKLCNRKFRRQHSIQNYIADFCCPSEKLIIELDGGVHDDPKQQILDRIRDERLLELEYRVVRFKNEMVFNDIKSVLIAIVENFST